MVNYDVFLLPFMRFRVHEFEHVKKVASREIRICGFIDIADIASPPYISRHLVLPIGTSQSSCGKFFARILENFELK